MSYARIVASHTLVLFACICTAFNVVPALGDSGNAEYILTDIEEASNPREVIMDSAPQRIRRQACPGCAYESDPNKPEYIIFAQQALTMNENKDTHLMEKSKVHAITGVVNQAGIEGKYWIHFLALPESCSMKEAMTHNCMRLDKNAMQHCQAEITKRVVSTQGDSKDAITGVKCEPAEPQKIHRKRKKSFL